MSLGLYLHIPFCDGKCPYCDFYSRRGSEGDMDAYTEGLCNRIAAWGEQLHRAAVDTVYFGGGTPSYLGATRLNRLLSATKEAFAVAENAEITAECNPRSSVGDFFVRLREGGFNRLSVGVQSFREEELTLLGRRHSGQDGERTLLAAKEAGFDNLSLDLMINLPGQTEESLNESLQRAVALKVSHLSVYMLKNEPGTAFESLPPMDDEQAAEQYRQVCETLEKAGYPRYEISNFAKAGKESRHNVKYWRGEEYLGLGPGAHSFLNGRRFYYPRDTAAFLRGDSPVDDGVGGSEQEKQMLGLRLTAGVPLNDTLREKAAPYIKAGFMQINNDRLSFTTAGFLVSNTILARIL